MLEHTGTTSKNDASLAQAVVLVVLPAMSALAANLASTWIITQLCALRCVVIAKDSPLNAMMATIIMETGAVSTAK
jgi:hypothetical protein